MLPELVTPIPGPESLQLIKELARFESANITYYSDHFPIFWARASGVNVWDVDGNRFLDLTSGFGVASLGFNPDTIVSAIRDQAGLIYHAMGDVHPTMEKVRLCAELSRLTFENWLGTPGKTILTNSGSEAVEAALKTAFLATQRRGVLAFSGSYHGLGFGALTATGRTYFRDPFQEQLADWAHFLPFPQRDAAPIHLRGSPNDHEPHDPDCAADYLAKARQILAKEKIGAILVEPIQGRGGEVVPSEWFLPMLRSLADELGAVLIFDEIFTGFYRTGPRFACDASRTVPDLVCLGKALTSGFPLAACVGRADMMDRAWPRSTGEALHTSTFLGNPLGCRMALTSLAQLEGEPWAERVRGLGAHLAAGLDELRRRSVRWGNRRGMGLMQGLEVIDAHGNPDPATAGRLIEGALKRGLIVLSGGVAGNVMSFTPPFLITPEEIDFALENLAQLLDGAR